MLQGLTLWRYAVPFRNAEVLHFGSCHSLSHPIQTTLHSVYESSPNIMLFCFRLFVSYER